jgi:long-chain acyl-CoA synthetase
MNLADHASSAAQSPALIVADGETISYGDLHARSQRVAALLHEAGLGRGDAVAIMLPNRPEFLEVAWGCQLSGLYYTPVNTHLTFDEIAYIVDDCEARALFIDSSFAHLGGKLCDANPRVDVLVSVGGSISGWRS